MSEIPGIASVVDHGASFDCDHKTSRTSAVRKLLSFLRPQKVTSISHRHSYIGVGAAATNVHGHDL
jgi:hypothetical protein